MVTAGSHPHARRFRFRQQSASNSGEVSSPVAPHTGGLTGRLVGGGTGVVGGVPPPGDGTPVSQGGHGPGHGFMLDGLRLARLGAPGPRGNRGQYPLSHEL